MIDQPTKQASNALPCLPFPPTTTSHKTQKQHTQHADSRAYGEIVWLFRRPLAFSSSQDDNDEEEEEEGEGEEVVAEVRWFHTPAELLLKPEDRA
jgi:hypothetical protein